MHSSAKHKWKWITFTPRWRFSSPLTSSSLTLPAAAAAVEERSKQTPYPSLNALKHQQHLKQALDFLHTNPNITHTYFYARLLRDCGRLRSLTHGRKVHQHIIASGLDHHRFLSNLLINMYGKCGSLDEARLVFDGMQKKDVVSWTSFIGACSHHGRGKEAIVLFKQMLREGLEPNKVTFVSVLNACKDKDDLADGRFIHNCLRDCEDWDAADVVVSTALANMYGMCGSAEDARQVFDSMVVRNVLSWTVAIAAYAQQGKSKYAFQLFAKMQQEGVKPDKVTLLSILNACASPAFLREGTLIHSQIVHWGSELDIVLANSVVCMYAKCGDLEGARKMFHGMKEKDLVSWNVMVAAFAQHGDASMALRYFREMQLEGVKPDKVSLVSIINACASPSFLPDGKLIHAYVCEHGFTLDATIGNALVNMYGKCGRLQDAQCLFDDILERNTLSWNVMLTLYNRHGKSDTTVRLFDQMQMERVQPDRVTFVSILDACGELASLEVGKSIHSKVIHKGLERDVVVGTALLNMYRKCGCLEDARKTFNLIQGRNLISWTAMIAAYAQHGYGKEALELFGQMQWISFKPNEVSLVSVLSACSHAGLVEEGSHYSMSFNKQGSESSLVEQFGCVLDLLGRSGNLDEAELFISNILFQPGPVI
ncbi:hypothetical protein O6H91_09G007900 [Diphasiastrum complanatum]|uniref:Uncharacterized protein n=1 Tax=Diphasiastrum complanatum TaxID=34168 RepID=A0ACC2CL50_DIPCM|nr:hypothetical protein O6H91_09G007900 [Diphasiastrum complanatum]